MALQGHSRINGIGGPEPGHTYRARFQLLKDTEGAKNALIEVSFPPVLIN